MQPCPLTTWGQPLNVRDAQASLKNEELPAYPLELSNPSAVSIHGIPTCHTADPRFPPVPSSLWENLGHPGVL